MAIPNAKGNVKLLKQAFTKHVAMGEGVISSDFEMTISGMENLTTLVQAAQIPPFGREEIETFGPMGVQFYQQAGYNNAGEMPVTFKEVISGPVLEAIRNSIAEKQYLEITMKLIGESIPDGVEPLKFRMSECFIKLDGVDLSVEDRTALVKPAGTIRYNWSELLSGKGY